MIFGKVYLAGPISGLDYTQARDGWRKEFARLLSKEILVYSPMRAKDYLEGQEHMDEDSDKHFAHPETSPRAILTRDHNDIRNCDVFVANFLGAKTVSIGTCVEFGFAFAYMKPVVVIMEKGYDEMISHFVHEKSPIKIPNGKINIHSHPFINAIAGYRVETLEEAAKIVTSILTPGV